MAKISKKAKELGALDREKLYSVEEALTTLRQFTPSSTKPSKWR